ncbi:MAG: hypothetical protein DRN68_08485 [Thaumarchaeota archaeon]|nr:MAG: hypothetical protein DRN68_08485 [Nitrososphaerota archaeon]
MAMDPITWLLLVSVIISIYFAGVILNRITWSRNKPQSPQEIQEPIEHSIEPQPELEAINIQIIETPTPEKVEPSSEPGANTSSDQAKEEKQAPKKRSEEDSEERLEEKLEKRSKTEEKLFKPYIPRQRELKRKDVKEMLETAQELKNELLKLKTILEKG